MRGFQKITLNNGLRILLVPQAQSLAVTVLVLAAAGSKYETKNINGISHFLEHMCFKGTKKRPRSIDIASELDSIGSQYNAFTSLEYTGYYAKSQPEHFKKILDIISDIYLNQLFIEEEIDKEKGVIIEEINMILDTPMRHIGSLWMELLYGNQPAGWDVAGRKEVIQKLKRNDFVQYHNEHYLAQSSLVVLAGKFNKKEAIEKIKQAFVALKTSKKTPKIKTRESQSKPTILLKHKDTDQTHLIIGSRAFALFDKRRYALQVLSGILGSGMSSRLFQKIREEMGAAYYVRSEADLYTDHGYLAISAGVDHRKLEAVIKAIIEEFKKIVAKPVSPKELNRVKEYLVGNLMLSLETSDELAGFYGGQEVLAQKLVAPQELAKKIKAVKPEEIQKVSREIFQNRKLNLALIGPLQDKKRFEKILKI